MARRLMLVTVCLLASGLWLHRAHRQEEVPAREVLARFPMAIDSWMGESLPDFDPKVSAILGAADYLNRVYLSADSRLVGLYIGYYSSQRQGDTIHSPLNCLPGAGWEPISSKRLRMTVSTGVEVQSGTRTIEVNRYLITKGLERQLVLYWYQTHGRVIASEYWGKLYLVADAFQLNRTDGALVRVIRPIVDSGTAAEQEAEQDAAGFVKSLFPLLGRYLPT
jgi:EpsI family protein